jgi:5-methylcytosine-specific restriction endonuclease McrA
LLVGYSREYMRAYMAERRARIRAELVVWLGGHCAWCGSTEDLEFDHIDPATKLFAIASGLDRPRAQLLAEVAKCQLLCAPHHREKTEDDGPSPNHVRGEQTGTARLTAADVREIRAATGVSPQVLAAAYGVARSTIRAVLERKSWQHI